MIEDMVNKNITIKDVAKLAQVSTGTVDRVIHNRGKVSDKNLKKVQAAIKELSYSPSQIASALSYRKNPITIGITYPAVDIDFWNEIPLGIKAARKQLEPFGVNIIEIPTTSYGFAEQNQALKKLLEMNVNAIIFCAVNDFSSSAITPPSDVPFATIVNKTRTKGIAFHIGPNDFQIGQLSAKLASLYTCEKGNALILSPNASFTGTQERVAGFISKINQEKLGIEVLKTENIEGESNSEIKKNIYEMAIKNISNYPELNCIYVTNGFFSSAADAIIDTNKVGKIKLIGHEYTKNMKDYLATGALSATIYQHQARQTYLAIMQMFNHLQNKQQLENSSIQCSIIMKETLSIVKIGESDLL